MGQKGDSKAKVCLLRQWVLSLPLEISYRLAYDGPLIGALLAVLLRAITQKRGCMCMAVQSLSPDLMNVASELPRLGDFVGLDLAVSGT